jgi:hypothetical protein
MNTNYLIVTDPVGTLKSQYERLLFKRDLGAETSDNMLLAMLNDYVNDYVDIMIGMGRRVALTSEASWKWLKRIEVYDAEGELVCMRDIQVLYLEVEKD